MGAISQSSGGAPGLSGGVGGRLGVKLSDGRDALDRPMPTERHGVSENQNPAPGAQPAAAAEGEREAMGRADSAWGAGLPIGLVTAGWWVVTLLGHWLWYPSYSVRGGLRVAFAAAGALLLVVGLSLYVLSVRYFRSHRPHGLVTTGPYAYVRHPLYALWVFLLVPGLALVGGSWLFLTVPPVMYAATGLFVREEEARLCARHGQPYVEYKARTRALLPAFGNRAFNKGPGLPGRAEAARGQVPRAWEALPHSTRKAEIMAATVDAEKCTGCEACVEVCPVDAISVDDGLAKVNAEECTECGLCVEECPSEAISLPG